MAAFARTWMKQPSKKKNRTEGSNSPSWRTGATRGCSQMDDAIPPGNLIPPVPDEFSKGAVRASGSRVREVNSKTEFRKLSFHILRRGAVAISAIRGTKKASIVCETGAGYPSTPSSVSSFVSRFPADNIPPSIANFCESKRLGVLILGPSFEYGVFLYWTKFCEIWQGVACVARGYFGEMESDAEFVVKVLEIL